MKPIILWKYQRFEYGCLLFDMTFSSSVSLLVGKTIGITENKIQRVFPLKVFISTNFDSEYSFIYKCSNL